MRFLIFLSAIGIVTISFSLYALTELNRCQYDSPTTNEESLIKSKNVPLYTAFNISNTTVNTQSSTMNKSEETIQIVVKTLSEPFTRGIVVYLPSNSTHDLNLFLPQLKWLLRSWHEMKKYEPELWRTDILVVTEKYISEFKAMNCTTILRTDFSMPGKCRVLYNYSGLTFTEDVLSSYKFADSISIFTYPPLIKAVEHYDWLLRSDLDVFLTPGFATWNPDKFVVGNGQYVFKDFTRKRLQRISENMKINPKNKMIDNVGSTWFGPTDMILNCANSSMNIMRYIHTNEFTPIERSPEISGGAKNWPFWHYGVLALYGGQIAINHCADEKFERRADLLDFPTSSNDHIMNHVHLHTFQNRENFSKLAFQEGSYSNVEIKDLNISIVSDYAMYMALDAQKMYA